MIDDIQIYPLKQISVPKGDVWHGLKKTDSGYVDFGELYFSNSKPNEIKGWKKHLRMTLNLIVIKGEVEFVFFDDRISSSSYNKFQKITSSDKSPNYQRITVPPGIWMAFRCTSKTEAMLIDIIDEIHQDDESLKKNITDIKYNW
jgi:dTDP-4-dehydrorhamnose 3,5-epimerase